MNKTKKSGSAIFMYIVIGFTLVIACVCFALYYTDTLPNGLILWIGIVAFTILYHFWLRIIMGNVTKLFNIRYTQRWFAQLPFEPKLYRILRVKQWKGRALTYDPQAFSLKEHTLEQIAHTMSKSETDHWVNQLISLSTVLFGLMWGYTWLFAVTALAAMLFDAQFIVIQRFNRPRVVRLIKEKSVRTREVLQ